MSWRGLEDFLDRARDRLDPARGPEQLPETGEGDFLSAEELFSLRAAAVLIGIRPGRATGEPSALLTRRPETMARHAGQVAFPGGKVDPHDADAAAAALREAHEEVGLMPEGVALVARGAPYVTGSGFRVSPLIALIPEDFEAVPCPREVAAVFEVPLAFLMEPANFIESTGVWRGQERRYVEMPPVPGGRIWGVTAGIVRDLYRRLYAG